MAYSKTFKEVDTDNAWMKVKQRLYTDDLLPEEKKIIQYSSLTSRIAYAATILLIVAVGSLSYLLFFDSPSSRFITLQTGADNSTFIQTLDDGSVVYMADNSVLDYPEFLDKGQRKVFFSGEAFFDVSHKTDQPFVIETNHALIEVLGTAFNIKSHDLDFEVIVEEGYVKVMPTNFPGHSEIISEWEMLSLVDNNMEKSPVIDRTYLSWRTNRMQFKDEKIANIASVISKNFNVNIYFEDESINERRLTVTFHNNAINTIAEVIATAYGLDYEILPDSDVLFRNKN